jgi:hypothetical protein
LNDHLGRQHFQRQAQGLSPDHHYHDLAPEAEDLSCKEQPPEIDLVNEPQAWILGFDAGFNNRPLVSGNTLQYLEGYVNGQHAWRDPAASPSPSSTASESSSWASHYTDTIDPYLLDLDARADEDLFKTPTPLTTATRSGDRKSNIPNHEFNNTLSLPLGGLHQSNRKVHGSPTPSPSPAGMHDSAPGSGHLPDMKSSSLDFPLSTTASNTHKAYLPSPSWMLINAHRISRAHSAPAARPTEGPTAYNAHGSMDHECPSVRHSLSMAKQARVEAELFKSQGKLDEAAAAAVDAAHWEKKARRRQSKNESQRKMRAQKRARKSIMRK